MLILADYSHIATLDGEPLTEEQQNGSGCISLQLPMPKELLSASFVLAKVAKSFHCFVDSLFYVCYHIIINKDVPITIV